jgi:branched-chain amino acid transport system permease protein
VILGAILDLPQFVTLLVNGLANGAILALAALGFVLIYKATEVINFAQGQFLVIGAFMIYNAHVTWGLPWPLAILIALVASILLGVAIERVILRPLVGESTLSVIMVTIGLAAALFALDLLIWGGTPRPGPDFMPKGQVTLPSGAVVGTNLLTAVAVAAVVFILVGLFFQKSRHGVAMRAVAEDQQAAMVQGISVNRIFAMSWALAAASGVIGGLLLANISNSTSTDLEAFAVLVFPVVIVGGLDSIIGTVAGGIIVGLVKSFSSFYFHGGVDEIIPFVVLVFILLVKPYGLFGQVRIERV